MTTNQPIITLTTDFGLSDGYVGAMQGVILNICPTATIINISHQVPPQNIQAGAFVLYQMFDYYPARAIHCVVVDPGVGSQRRAVAARTGHGIFVGPDNGVLSLVLGASPVIEAFTLTNPKYQLPAASATFHGRDIFAPACAHIAAGVSLSQFGPPASNLTITKFGAELNKGQCRVIHIDHFGNLILDITAQDVSRPEDIRFQAGGFTIKSLSRTFADVPDGELLAYIGSNRSHVEIAVRNGNAAKALGLQLNDVVQVSQ